MYSAIIRAATQVFITYRCSRMEEEATKKSCSEEPYAAKVGKKSNTMHYF
jgi:hypothetical protein